jgi:hypothetical protein
MNHEQFRTFSKVMRGGGTAEVSAVEAFEALEENEAERQRRLRLERAQRLKSLAPGNRGNGIPLETLAAWSPAFAVAVLGLPPSVLFDELKLERAELSRLTPLTLSGR